MGKYKIRASHILVDIENEREAHSINVMSELSNYGIDYKQNINERYRGNQWREHTPVYGWVNHSEGHWGLYQAFKRGVYEHFTDDLDAFLVFEADCVINVSAKEFREIVDNAIEYCNDNNLTYLSFGPRGLPNEVEKDIYFSNEVEHSDSDMFMITDKTIYAHCILFTKKARNILLDNLGKSWDTLDLWLNSIYQDNPRIGITRYPIAIQEGESMIDANSISDIDYSTHVNIITSHISNDWKKVLLEECVNTINKGDTILSCNSDIDSYLMNKFDWVIYSRENPVIHKSEYSKYDIDFFYENTLPDNSIKRASFEYEHSWAAYNLILNGLRYAKSLGKKTATVISYDYQINSHRLEKDFGDLNNHDLVVYTQDHLGDIGYSSGYFSGKIDTLLDFFTYYKDIDHYYHEFILLEVKMKGYFDNTNAKIKSSLLSDLRDINLIDREGIPPFNNMDPTFNRFKIISDRHGCDKTTRHSYDKVYNDILYKYINKEISLLEIGIGEGRSLKVWKEFLPKAEIWGIDIKTELAHSKGRIIKGDQSNIDDLKKITTMCEVIIDDGSHVVEHQIISFEYLFVNTLKSGGIYVIEDIETSYWGKDVSIYGYKLSGRNIVDYFNDLNHSIHSEYNNIKNDLGIKDITYSPNCIIIRKR